MGSKNGPRHKTHISSFRIEYIEILLSFLRSVERIEHTVKRHTMTWIRPSILYRAIMLCNYMVIRQSIVMRHSIMIRYSIVIQQSIVIRQSILIRQSIRIRHSMRIPLRLQYLFQVE